MSFLKIPSFWKPIFSYKEIALELVSKTFKSKNKNLEITKHDDDLQILLESEIKEEVPTIDYSDQLKEIDSKLNVILKNMFESPTLGDIQKLDKKDIDEEQIFIPKANIDGMTITQTNIDSSEIDNLDLSVNALKNIKKLKKK